MDVTDYHQRSRSKLAIWLVIAICFLKFLVVTAVIPNAKEAGLAPPGGDRKDLYLEIATNVAQGNGYRVTEDSGPTMVRAPGYVFVLAAGVWLFGEDLSIVRVTNGLFGVGAMLIAMALARQLGLSLKGQLWAVIVTGLYPLVLLTESRVNVESQFTFLLLAFFFLFYQATKTRRLLHFALAGAVLGLAASTRSSAVFFLAFLAFYLVAARLFNWPVMLRLRDLVVLCILTLVVLTPWAVRNYIVGGKFTFAESHVGIGAYQGWYATKTADNGLPYQGRIGEARAQQQIVADRKGIAYKPIAPPGDTRWDVHPDIQSEIAYNQALLEIVLADYEENPGLLMRHMLWNLPRFWFQGAGPGLTFLITAMQLPLLILAIIGAWTWRRRFLDILPFVLMTFALWGVHVPLISHARYSVPLVPVLGILSAITIQSIIDRWFQQEKTDSGLTRA